MSATNAIELDLTSGDLVAELAARAPDDGANTGLWPGLTIYRFHEPTEPRWDEIHSLSVGVVAQGRKVVTADGRRCVYGQFTYLVIRDHLHFQCRVLDASPDEPFLSFVLQIEPALVRRVSTDMLDERSAPSVLVAVPDQPDPYVVSTLDDELLSSVLRFLRSLSDRADRRVLAPLYLQEMVYLILQREQFALMLHFAALQATGNPMAAALTYISDHLAEPLTVDLLARQVNLSPSAFTRAFRDLTSRSPYNYVKEMRLNRARELLIERRLVVADVSATVGYSSTSHFIKEFRLRFGATPRDFANAHALGAELRAVRAVAR